VENLKEFKHAIEEYNSQSEQSAVAADTYKLVTMTSDGHEVVKSFNKSEYSQRAKLLYNDIMNSIDEMGQAITDQEKRQILFEILEKLC
jgi:tRNA U34 5-carboxymethylaminomethyl modifying GTPase MnmE/TrmE